MKKPPNATASPWCLVTPARSRNCIWAATRKAVSLASPFSTCWDTSSCRARPRGRRLGGEWLSQESDNRKARRTQLLAQLFLCKLTGDEKAAFLAAQQALGRTLADAGVRSRSVAATSGGAPVARAESQESVAQGCYSRAWA